MPCYSMVESNNLTRAEREKDRAKRQEAGDRLRALERLIASGAVKLKRDRMGKVQFDGWAANRGDWHDDCAFRALSAEGSSELRLALSRLGPAGTTGQAVSR